MGTELAQTRHEIGDTLFSGTRECPWGRLEAAQRTPATLGAPAAGDPPLPWRDGARGRHRGAPEQRQDDAVQRPHARRRRDHGLCVGDREAERRHGRDRRRPPPAARRARLRPEGDARGSPRRRRPGHRPRAARQPAPGRRDPRGPGRLLGRTRRRPTTSRRCSSSCSSPTAITSSGGWSASRRRRSRATRRSGPSSTSLDVAHRARRCRAGRSPTGRASCRGSSTR